MDKHSVHYVRELDDCLLSALRRCEVLIQKSIRSPDKKDHKMAETYDEIHRQVFAAHKQVCSLAPYNIMDPYK